MARDRGSVTPYKTDPDRWRIRAAAGIDPSTRRERRLSKVIEAPHNRTGRRQAEEALAAMLVQATAIKRGTQRRPEGITVAELAERWLDHHRGGWAPNTYRGHDFLLGRIILPTIGKRRVDDLTREEVQALYRSRAHQPCTARKVHQTLAQMCRDAERWDLIERDPTRHVKPPRYEAPEIAPPDRETVAAALAQLDAEESNLALFVRLAAHLGSRRGELAGLQWRDFDHDAGTVLIARTIRKGHSEHEWEVGPTKTRSRHRVAIGPTTLGHVVAAEVLAAQRAKACGARIGPTCFVFSPSLDGTQPPRPDTFTKRWGQVRDRYGLHGVKLHGLRHYVATQLLADGVDIVTVSGRLAHSQKSTTLNMYASFQAPRDRDAATLLD